MIGGALLEAREVTGLLSSNGFIHANIVGKTPVVLPIHFREALPWFDISVS